MSKLIEAPRRPADAPAVLDHAMVSTPCHLLALGALLAVCIGVGGLPGAVGVVLGVLMGHGLPLCLLDAHVQDRKYRRALWLARRLGHHWTISARMQQHLALVEIGCLICLGDRDAAKAMLAGLDDASLAPHHRHTRALLQAHLFSAMGDGEGALAVLGESPLLTDVAPSHLPFHLHRAWIFHWSGKDDAAAAELAHIRRILGPTGTSPEVEHLDALRILEIGTGAADAAVALERIVRELAQKGRSITGPLLDLVMARLEAGADPVECLEQLDQVTPDLSSIGQTGRADYHYLRASCLARQDQRQDALREYELAVDLPSYPRLRRRILALGERLGSPRGGCPCV